MPAFWTSLAGIVRSWMIGDLIGVAKAALQLVLSVSDNIRESKLMDAGEARNVARQMTELSSRLDIGEEVMFQIEKMRDEEVDAALRGDR